MKKEQYDLIIARELQIMERRLEQLAERFSDDDVAVASQLSYAAANILFARKGIEAATVAMTWEQALKEVGAGRGSYGPKC